MPIAVQESSPEVPRLVTPRFAIIALSGLAYFIGFSALYPVLPRYVEDLGGSGLEVGLAIGSFGVTAALLRPVVGRLGDRHGRRVLVMGGMAVAVVALLGHLWADTVTAVIGLRLLFGVGEAAAFVGLATAVQDMAPTERRAEAASYFSASVYGGIAMGPLLGDRLVDRYDYDAIWLTLAAVVAVGVVLGWAVPTNAVDPVVQRPDGSRRFIHPEAVWPGLALGAAMVGYAGFVSFITLLIDERGIGNPGVAFSVYALLTLTGRLVGARVGDRVSEVKVAAASLVLISSGLCVMAAWATALGLYLGIVGLAGGMALNFPALLALVTRRAPEQERGHAIASFIMFFDLAFSLGALLVGGVVALTGRPTGIAFGAVIALAGLPALVKAQTARPSGRECSGSTTEAIGS